MAHSLPARVIGVAASAGGVEALRQLVRALPRELDAALAIVLHIPPTGTSLLAPILARDTPWTVVVAEHGRPLERGTVYVAPSDHHLQVLEDRVELNHGPKENGARPAADPLFRSIASAWGARGTAVVLSGALDDGAAGAAVVKEAGGTVFVQDPHDALVPGMPTAAIAATTPDAVLALPALAERLAIPSVPHEEVPASTEPTP